MNVLLLTMDEPMYMPRYLRPVIENYTEDIERLVIAPHPGEDLATTIQQRYEMFGLETFVRYGIHFGVGKILGTLPPAVQTLTGRYHSIRALCADHGIPVRVEEDVNSNEFVRRVRALDIDLILSISCGQRLSPRLLAVPSEGAINVHGSLLPKYRGRATAFWVLYHDEEYSGVSAHYMSEDFDDGDIVLQREFPIEETDTMNDVYTKIVETGAEVAQAVIEQVKAGDVTTKPNPSEAGEYRSLPDAEDRAEFHRRGKAFR